MPCGRLGPAGVLPAAAGRQGRPPEGEDGGGQEAQQGGLLDAQDGQVIREGGVMPCSPGAGERGRSHGRQVRPGL
jgi:hypothetical protein